ncbi:MAG: SoxR reducing system RseC family protein [Nitrospirota bacterium]
MKPSIPDTGTVIRLEGDHAVIRMKHEGSCAKCGAAAIGLCKGGLMQELTVKNSQQARIGDTVKIGLVRGIQYRGFFLAYVIPAAGLLLGITGGHVAGAHAGFPALDILAGFFTMIAAAFFSLRRLKRLDAVNSIEIMQVISDPWIPSLNAGEETLQDYYSACY